MEISSDTTHRRTYVCYSVIASNRKYPIIIDEYIINRSLSCVYNDLNMHLSHICLIFDYFQFYFNCILVTWIRVIFFFFCNITDKQNEKNTKQTNDTI